MGVLTPKLQLLTSGIVFGSRKLYTANRRGSDILLDPVDTLSGMVEVAYSNGRD